jgi:hypothetical protein
MTVPPTTTTRRVAATPTAPAGRSAATAWSKGLRRAIWGPPTGPSEGADGCTMGCQIPAYCGDGIVDSDLGEQCDEGALNGNGASDCSADCKIIILL